MTVQLRYHTENGAFFRNFETQEEADKAISVFQTKKPRTIRFKDEVGKAEVILDQEKVSCISIDLEGEVIGGEPSTGEEAPA